MAANGLALPDGLRELFAKVNLTDVTVAIKNITLADFTHLMDFAKGRELNADTITKLYEEASKLPGAGSTFMAATLVILIIIFCFPMAIVTPVCTALGFVSYGIASASLAASFHSVFGVNPLFSALQRAAMSVKGVPIVAGAVKGVSAVGAVGSAFQMWSSGNYTMPAFPWK